MQSKLKKPSVFGGTLLIAGTTIGAGMLALPTVSAGMWTVWSIVLMVVTWLLMFWSSKALLEVNLHYEPGASFHSLVLDTLGPVWNIINGFSVAFVLYILLYAYISGGSSTISYFIESSIGVSANKVIVGLVFASILTFIIWLGAHIVDRMTSILVMGLIITFIFSMSGMLPSLKISKFIDIQSTDPRFTIFIWMAISTYVTSFNFHSSIPSLVKYFGKEPNKIHKSIVYGTVIVLVSYTIWVIVAHGAISRSGFQQVIAEGGNVGSLLKAAGSGRINSFLLVMLDMFAFLALTTSFFGCGLGLFDYIADLFKFDNTYLGRAKTAIVTFIPPIIGGIFFPNGFIVAIAWAGLFSIIWSIVIPAAMLLVTRKRNQNSIYTSFKGNTIPYILIFYGVFAAICHILVVFQIFPEYK